MTNSLQITTPIPSSISFQVECLLSQPIWTNWRKSSGVERFAKFVRTAQGFCSHRAWMTVQPDASHARGSEIADLQLVQRSLYGDKNAFQEIVTRYQTLISGRMWKFTRDQLAHEELVQDVFVEAFFSLSTYRAAAPFEHWLQKIATRTGYRYWKNRKDITVLSEEQLRSLAGKADQSLSDSACEAGELVHFLLARLPPADRLVITLMSLEECTVAETSRLTGWSETLVKVRAFRARAKLAALWKKIDATNSRPSR